MKAAIAIIALAVIGLQSNGQTVNEMTAVAIQPKSVYVGGSALQSPTAVRCHYLMAHAVDNLSSKATFSWALADSNRRIVLRSSAYSKDSTLRHIVMTGADYSGWNGSNSAALQYIASKLQLTIK